MDWTSIRTYHSLSVLSIGPTIHRRRRYLGWSKNVLTAAWLLDILSFSQERTPLTRQLLNIPAVDVQVSTNDVGHTGDSTLLRKVNESAVLELIRENGPLTRAELARGLNLSLPTITRIVSGFFESGLVHELRLATSRGGRRPTLLEFNYRANLIIGVYVGREMLGALVDLRGEILERRSLPSAPGDLGIQRLAELIDDLRRAADRIGTPVRGVGVGVPSIIDYQSGVVHFAPGLDWVALPLRARLAELIDLPIIIENSVRLLALGERWQGAGRGIDNLACMALGAGIGAGIILEGQLYRGAQQAAGEMGYMVPNERFLGTSYATYGCLESLAGSDGIVQRTMARLAAGHPSCLAAEASTNGARLTAERVLTAARANDPLAKVIVQETVDYLSTAILNLTCILNPERVIITGDLAEFGDLFLEPIRCRIRGMIPKIPDLVISDLKTDAAVLGAVAIVLRETSGAVVIHPSRA